jgi:hypothetical protein
MLQLAFVAFGGVRFWHVFTILTEISTFYACVLEDIEVAAGSAREAFYVIVRIVLFTIFG